MQVLHSRMSFPCVLIKQNQLLELSNQQRILEYRILGNIYVSFSIINELI